MEAVILAAGRSTRLYPLTIRRPKLLLPIADTTSLGHNLEQLSLTKLVKDVVIVVGFCADQVEAKFGNEFEGLRIHYAVQKEPLGTGSALLAAESLVNGAESFIVMMGDDLYQASDIMKCISHRNSILVKEVNNISDYGKVMVKGSELDGIVEKPRGQTFGLANTGCYVLSRSIFDCIRKAGKSERGEYELTSAVVMLSKTEKVAVEEASFWHPVSYTWSLLAVNEVMLRRLDDGKQRIAPSATVEEGVVLRGHVSIGEGTLVRSGTRIEGPCIIGRDCLIGSNSSIRSYTTIGNSCKIGDSVKVKNSILLNGVSLSRLSYCYDSIIGENAGLGEGAVTANARHDGASVKSVINGNPVDSRMTLLGTVIGDGARIGDNASIHPGIKIWPGKTTKPGEIVKGDIV